MHFIFWILKSILILFIFHFIVPTIVDAFTHNNWIKLPIMLVFAILAGLFMAWLNYIPYLLFFVWLGLNTYTLRSIKKEFESGEIIYFNKPLFYISSYLYIVFSCFLAWFFQMEIVNATDPYGKGVALWKVIFGMQ